MSAMSNLKAVLLDPDGNVSIRGSSEDIKIIQESLAEIEKQLDLLTFDAVKNRTKDIDDVIEEFLDGLDFDGVLLWARVLGVEINEPPTGDLWADWQAELTTEVGDAMRDVTPK